MHLGTLFFSVIVLLALAACISLWAFQSYGIYRFDAAEATPSDVGLEGFEVAEMTARDGTPVNIWIKQPEANAPVIISFHGNFTSVSASAPRLKPFADAGLGIALMKYRGSGASQGTSSEKAFFSDAEALYDQIDDLMQSEIPAENRIVHGFSLGSGVAIHLAANRPVKAVIIESGYRSLCDYFTNRFKGLPMCALMWRERFDSDRIVQDISAPILIAHGAQDRALPLATGQALFDAARDPKTLKIYPDGQHTTLPKFGFVDDALAFVGQ